MLTRLGQWQGQEPVRRRAMANISQRLAGTCAKLPAKDAGRANCTQLLQAG
ncbi:hypothetical protein [Ramlibacter sp.]